MRFLIITDTHANWRALASVLDDAAGQYEQIVCCGDLVGYNSEPSQVLDWTSEHCSAVVRGNHDKVVSGLESLDWFNETAQEAARWTMNRLSAEQTEYLRSLPSGPLQLEYFHIWHGSPRDEDEYVTSVAEATPGFEYLDCPLAFFGHTHVQGVFFAKQRRYGSKPGVAKNQTESVIELEPDMLYVINPGSVGQPRDGDPRAAYALYDTEERAVRLRRVEYDIEATAQAIRTAGLPEMLAQRLFYGF